MPERDQRRQRAAIAAGHVGVRVAEAHRRAARVGHHAGDIPPALQRRSIADVARRGPVCPKPRHTDADDIGLDFRQARVVHPPHPHHPSREIVHHQVAYRGETARQFDSARIVHIDRDRAFVAMQFALESDAPRTEHAHRIFVAALDFDHLGALVGENPRRHRSGDHPGEIENAHALECHPRHRHLCHGQITPSAARAASSSAPRPSSPPRMSPVCSPTSGGRRVKRHGEPVKR